MTWNKLLEERRVRTHVTSFAELFDLRELVERDLKDAAVSGLSADRRFAIAYNAVLQLAKMVIACAGYRVTGSGHHQTTFEALEIALGPTVSDMAAYFDTCRRKRNQLDYDLAHVAAEQDAEDLIVNALRFRDLVERWIEQHHPGLAR